MSSVRILVLVAVPALPAAAAAAISLLRPSGDAAARWAIRSSAVAAVAALALVVMAATEPVEAIVEGGRGRAVAGLLADRVTAVLAVLTAGVGLVVQSFAGRALAGDPRARRFFALASLLTAATTFTAMAATGSGFVLGWIVAGASLSALVGHRAGWEPAALASRQVRRSFAVGDVALLLGVLATATVAGDPDLRALAGTSATLAGARPAVPGAGGLLVAVAVLLVVAAVSRSAIMPLHRWLPATLAGPTPVSALLHAGVVNGAGVLLVRFAPVFGASAVATHLAFVLGTATAVVATGVMLTRTDVKGNLVWSTAGQMGFMVVQCAVGAFSAALFHIVGHGMYKAALFLGSGGAISAQRRHRHQPSSAPTLAPALRGLVAFAVPPIGLALAYAVIDPHLPLAGHLLVVVFAWATGTRAVWAWLDAAPFGTATTVATGTAAATLSAFAYLGGLATFEGFVAPALPTAVPAAVSPTVLGSTLVVLAASLVLLRTAPGGGGDALRRRAYTALLATGTPIPRHGEASPARSWNTATRVPPYSGTVAARPNEEVPG